MAQMKVSMKQKQIDREQIHGCQGKEGVGEGQTGILGLVDENYCI